MDYHVWFTVDTATGKLSAEPDTLPCSARPTPKDENTRDMWAHVHHWDHNPRLLAWTGPDYPIMASDARKVLTWMAPRVQELLDALQTVAGTAQWDWTVEAATLYQGIRFVTGNPSSLGRDGRLGEAGIIEWDIPRSWADYGFISFTQMTEMYPSQVSPLWAGMSDDMLTQEARRLARQYLTPPAGGTSRQPKSVVGALAGLHQWRAAAQDGREQVTASRWLTLFNASWIPDMISAGTSDKELRAIGVQLHTTGIEAGVDLVGIEVALADYRAGLRVGVRRELQLTGEQVVAAERAAAVLREQRSGLLAQVLAWADPEDCDETGNINYARLGRLASMSRQAVNTHALRAAEGIADR